MAGLLGVTGEALLDRGNWRSYRADGTPLQPQDAPGRTALRLKRSLPPRRIGYAYRNGPVVWVLGTAEYLGDHVIVRFRLAP
jgi:hypothetical protein